MLRSLIIVCVALSPFAYSIKIHEHMTRKEVFKTFQSSHDTVPDYQLVPVYHTLRKRNAIENSAISVKINAFDIKMSLYLEPNDGLLAKYSTPVWTVSPDEKNPENLNYTLVKNAFAKIGRAYQDSARMSAIIVYEGEDGKTLIHGNLNFGLIIRPLPHRLHDTIEKEMESSNDSVPNSVENDENFLRTHHHVVFKIQEPDATEKLKIVKRDRSNGTFENGRSKRSIPDAIYPEILVIVDYSLYTVLSKNVEEATRYVVALWNAVDLRFRLLIEPIIRLNIAGIIISMKSGGTPYLDNNRRGTTELDADLGLNAMSHYFYQESHRFNFSSYDMAMAMTHLDMCNMVYNDVCDTSTLGYAYEWGACNRSHVDQNTEAVGIVEDNGGYKAIISATHEVAHLMGVEHDGFSETMNCPAYDGFIMSAALNVGSNSFFWSTCSLRHLYEFISSSESICLLNKPENGVALPRLLPGKLQTLDEQCEKMYGTRACHHDDRVCSKLECYVPGKGDLCHSENSAAEGSYCGFERHCINGHCVNENVTFVPYTPPTTRRPLKKSFFENRHFLQRRKSNDIGLTESGKEIV